MGVEMARKGSTSSIGSSGLEQNAETNFEELNDPVREYHEVFGHELPPLPQKLVLSNFYTPSNEQHGKELMFIALSMIGIGGVLWYLED